MDRFELTRFLINKVDEYAQATNAADELSVEDFLMHLQQHESIHQSIEEYKNTFLQTTSYPTSEKHYHLPNNIDRIISQHLLYLYRYIKFYAKHVFINSKIRSIEEFGILMTVMQHQEISKSELIKKNIIEKSSGIEITNRLIKLELLYQKHNPNDSRSQLICLSGMGRMEVFQLFAQMDLLGTIATGELNELEKHQLAKLLKKLDHFHYENYTNKHLKHLNDYLPQKGN